MKWSASYKKDWNKVQTGKLDTHLTSFDVAELWFCVLLDLNLPLLDLWKCKNLVELALQPRQPELLTLEAYYDYNDNARKVCKN